MIRFGPSGIPLSCKGRTQCDGLEDVHILGLNAMEIQFVRVNTHERFADEAEVGLLPTEVADELIVDLLRPGEGGGPHEVVKDFETKIAPGDMLRVLSCGIAKDHKQLRQIGALAKDLDVRLTIHAPYYMDLLGTDEAKEKSLDNLHLTGRLAAQLQCDTIITHVGMYNGHGSEEATELVAATFKGLREHFKAQKIDASIGVEISGKQPIFGSLEEAIGVAKRVKGVVPAINFAHHHARESGLLKKKEDFEAVFELVGRELKTDSFYCHFSGVEHEGGNEKRYTPIKKGDLRFEPLAEALLEHDWDVTVISGSPLLEHDAMYMKVILERVALKRELKRTRVDVPETDPTHEPESARA